MNRENRANSISIIGFFISFMLLVNPMRASQAPTGNPTSNSSMDTKHTIEQQSLNAALASSANASSSSAWTPMTSPLKRRRPVATQNGSATTSSAMQTDNGSQTTDNDETDEYALGGVPSQAQKRRLEATASISTASASASSASASSSSAASPYPTPQSHLGYPAGPNHFPATGVKLPAGAYTALASGSSKEDTEATACAGTATAFASSAIASTASASSSSGYNGAQSMDLVMANNGKRTMAVEPQRGLIKPIKTYPGTLEEKRKLFIDTLTNHKMLADGLNRSDSHDITQQLEIAFAANNEELYHMLHDPQFRKMYKEKYRENSFAIIRAPFQIAVKNNDTQFVKDFAPDYFIHEGPDGDLTANLIHTAAEEQNPEMMLALIAIKNEGVRTQEQSLDTYFLFKKEDFAQEELTAIAFSAFQKTHSLIRKHRKDETVALCKELDAIIPTMPLEVRALIAQMAHPTEECRYAANRRELVANTIIHPDLEEALVKGNLKRFYELMLAGWVTANNRSQLSSAFKLATKNNQYVILGQLLLLTPFTVLEHIKKDIPEPADDKERKKWKKWVKETEKWTTEKNQELLTSLRDSQAIDCIRALQHGADPNMMVPIDQDDAQSPLAPIAFLAAGKPPFYLKVLTAYGANPNATRVDRNNETDSLLGEVMHGDDYDEESVKILLEAGADPNTLDSNGNPLAFYTIEVASGDEGRSYTHGLEHFINTENFNINAQITRRLNDGMYSPDLNHGPIKTQSLLGWSVHWNNFKQARLLRNAGASLNDLDPIWAALFQENQEQLQHVLTKITNYDDIDIDQLCVWAIWLEKPRHLEIILKNGRFQYIKDFLWIMQAAAENEDPNYLQIIASTPEFKKCAQGQVFLKITRRNNYSRAIDDAVGESIANNHPEHLKILLETGANPNVFCLNGMGILEPIALVAIQTNNLACLKVFLEHGLKPSLEFKDKNGHSYSLALWAFTEGYNDAYDMLVNYQPAPQINQQTAAAPADQKESAETSHLMKS